MTQIIVYEDEQGFKPERGRGSRAMSSSNATSSALIVGDGWISDASPEKASEFDHVYILGRDTSKTSGAWKLIAVLALMLMLAVPAFAQDETATPVDTDVPAATLEASPAPTEEAIATQEVIIIVTQTPAESPTPTLTPTPEMTATAVAGGGTGGNGGTTDNTTSNAFANIGWVLFLLTLSALAFVLVTWMRELRKSAAAGDQNSKNLLNFVTATQSMLPVDGFLALIDNLDKRAKATPTPGEVDDKVLAQLRAYVYEALGKNLPPEVPTAPDSLNG